ncbi:hypothetical protein CBS101457_003228 [Exobasidium rhododendri]|nr:hypothetical protein CBS101457_003228 [Exobasidium rhododendri]
MRISIPSIPTNASPRIPIEYTIQAATDLVSELFTSSKGKVLVMTGAGVSVDSGIAPYRGADGHYTVHKTYRPIFFHEFTDESEKGHLARQRYWSRSFLGYVPVLNAKPNKTHYSIAALQRMGYFDNYITQNVDSLHHAATPSPSLAASTILELHGTLQSVVCVTSPTPSDANAKRKRPVDPAQYDLLSQSHLSASPRRQATPVAHNTPTGEAYPKGCGFRGSRAIYQEELGRKNPRWKEFAQEMKEKGTEPKTNPDGDVDLGNADYASFNYGACPNCGGALKPAVIFFGESVPDKLRDHSYKLIDECESMLMIGTSLATYSAFRLVKAAQEQGKRTMIINKGPTRADPIVQDKIELGSSEVMNAVAKHLAGDRAKKDPVLHRLLESGKKVALEQRKGVVSS